MGDHLFVSYSHLDQAIVDKLVARLQQTGVAIWRDHESLRVGTPDWEEAVRRGIKSAFAVIYAASLDGAKSPYVRHELLIARDAGIPLYPIWISGTIWSDCVPLGFAHYQFADGRTDLDGAVRSVLATGAPRDERAAGGTILIFSGFIDDVFVETGERHRVWCALFKLTLEERGYRVHLHTSGIWTWGDETDVFNSVRPDVVVLAIDSATGPSMTQMFRYGEYYSAFLSSVRQQNTIVLVAKTWRPELEVANPMLPLITIGGENGERDAWDMLPEFNRRIPRRFK